MIKVVVAYVDAENFERIRHDLADAGISSFSVAAAGGASTDTFVAAHFRGTPHTQNLAEKLRLEVVVGADHVEDVKRTILARETRRPFLYVHAVEEVVPADTVLLGEDAARTTA